MDGYFYFSPKPSAGTIEWSGPEDVTNWLPATSGWQPLATFDNPVEKLQVRHDRLTAYVNGMWHIIPTPKP